MINLEIEKKLYKVPENWEEMNVYQFQQLYKIMEEEENLAKRIKVFQILTNYQIDKETIDGFDIAQFNEILSKFTFVNDKPDIEVDKEEPIIIDDQEYYLIDLEDISVGEWADLEYQITNSEGNIINKIPELMSVLLRPKDEKYDNKIANKRIKLFRKKASGIIGLKFIDFFLTSEFKYINNLMSCSTAQLTKKDKEQLLKKIGVGLAISTD